MIDFTTIVPIARHQPSMEPLNGKLFKDNIWLYCVYNNLVLDFKIHSNCIIHIYVCSSILCLLYHGQADKKSPKSLYSKGREK